MLNALKIFFDVTSAAYRYAVYRITGKNVMIRLPVCPNVWKRYIVSYHFTPKIINFGQLCNVVHTARARRNNLTLKEVLLSIKSDSKQPYRHFLILFETSPSKSPQEWEAICDKQKTGSIAIRIILSYPWYDTIYRIVSLLRYAALDVTLLWFAKKYDFILCYRSGFVMTATLLLSYYSASLLILWPTNSIR